MSRFLFATMPIPGHVAPVAPVARALVERGHEVVWYTSAAFAAAVEKTGATAAPLVTPLDYGDGDLTRHFPDRIRYSGIRQLVYDFEHVFVNVTEGYVHDLRAIAARFVPDVLVTDPAVIAGAVLEEVDGLPTATVNISVLALPDPDLAPFGLGLAPTRGRLGRLRNSLLTLLLDRVVFARPNRVYRRLARQHGWPVLPIRPRTGSWLFLQPSVPALEYPRSALPPQVHFVGALLPAVADGAGFGWEEDVRAARTAGRPVVLVTQGTIATDPTELIQPTLTALAEDDVLVLAAGADPARLNVPANARVGAVRPLRPADAPGGRLRDQRRVRRGHDRTGRRGPGGRRGHERGQGGGRRSGGLVRGRP